MASTHRASSNICSLPSSNPIEGDLHYSTLDPDDYDSLLLVLGNEAALCPYHSILFSDLASKILNIEYENMSRDEDELLCVNPSIDAAIQASTDLTDLRASNPRLRFAAGDWAYAFGSAAHHIMEGLKEFPFPKVR